MIVPQSRLLIWTGGLGVPTALIAALEPATTGLGVLLGAVWVSLAFLDALRGRARAQSGNLSIQLPALTRLTQDKEAFLEVRLRQGAGQGASRPLRVRLGLVLPDGLQTRQESRKVMVPAGNEWAKIPWDCRPVRRGKYRVNRFYVEESSPLGLWAVQSALPVQSELRVYPDLRHERKNLAALFLNRGVFGLHVQRQVGKGREFEKLREYLPGDSYEDIHWKATAKRGHPVTKVYQIERTQEVYVMLDVSRLSGRPVDKPGHPPPAEQSVSEANADMVASDRIPVLERYITTGLILGMAAEQQGDLFGLLAFSDRVHRFVRASNGHAHYQACREALYTLQPGPVNPDYAELGTFLRLRLRRRALVILLTALDDPLLAEQFVRHIQLISRRHLVLVNMIRPPGAYPLFSNPDVRSTDDLYRQLGGHERWHDLRELEKTLQRHGMQFTLLDNEKMGPQLVSQYLSVKHRQLL
jgi:uncharacterized protein (DUF58 family)